MIEAANRRAATAMMAADLPAMLANYADNAIVMQPGISAMRGRVAIEEGMRQMSADASLSNVSFNTEDVLTSNDIAVETGTYIMTVKPKGGGPVDDKGKYLTVWQRQADGTWKIARDISNSNPSAPAR